MGTLKQLGLGLVGGIPILVAVIARDIRDRFRG